ncbi:fat storage-inducing transmembrane protein 1 [Maylandia zebra]|uniref:Fat storage-inducing transmembrane protein 1 homolog n=2 Tax=Haplochromini TaxID=319058 RepID=A0A3P9C134_9CICH|nr:fat storage-inducing transmembrane protein 1 [Maylandia zebra]XP_026035802.1 fat storage-inducing transmembrane protein 1-like [Astatotilapia calliptera]
MNLKTGNSSNGFTPEISLDKLHRMAAELILPGRSILRLLNTVLEFVTNFLARVLGSSLIRRHFHLLLSGLVLFGPVLSFWVSKYSIFANSNHYLYRKFLRSTWGWTCIFTSAFIILLSLSVRHSTSLSLRHLSRVGLTGLLWWSCQRLLTLLEDAAGTCYEPMTPGQDGQSPASPVQPLLLLHEDQNKASCLKAHMLWRGYEVSQDVLILCFCCLLLVEEMCVFGHHLERQKPLQRSPGTPLRVVFLLCVLLLLVWMFLLLCLLAYFPKFPSQQLGGALGYLGWRGLYHGLYRLGSRWGCPGLPREGLSTTVHTNKQP